MSDRKTWQQWQGHFNALFGASDWIDASAAAWISDVFIPCGYTADELDAAAVTVARGGPPAKPHEILNALLGELRESRARDLMAREEQSRRSAPADGDPSGVCPDCHGSGLAVVPHEPQPALAQAKGYLATHAVTCRCAAGLRMARVCRDHNGAASMTLEDYESRHGRGWREAVTEARRKQAADGNVGHVADRAEGLARKLALRMGVPKDERAPKGRKRR